MKLTKEQIGLLRDFRMNGFMAFFDSPYRSEGPGLREVGAFAGVGDSTHISAEAMAALKAADALLSARSEGGEK